MSRSEYLFSRIAARKMPGSAKKVCRYWSFEVSLSFAYTPKIQKYFFWFLDYVDSIFQSSQKSRCPDHKHRWGFSTVVDASGTVPVLEVERLECLGFIPVILHESFSGFSLACLCFYFYSPNSWNSFKDSYFKYRGEGLQIFWICFGGVFDAALLHIK